MNTCPHCNKPIPPTTGGEWQTNLIQTFEATASPPWAKTKKGQAPTFVEATRKSPARGATVEADVFVPLLQSLITATIGGIISILLFVAIGWVWYISIAVWVVVWGIAWFFLLLDQRSLLWTVESIINKDLDGDGHTGKPKTKSDDPPPVPIQVKTGLGRWKYDNLPGPREALYKFAGDVCAGVVTFAENGADKSGYGATAFRELRDRFIQQGWAQWKVPGSPKQGIQLTHEGAEVLASISQEPPPAPLLVQ